MFERVIETGMIVTYCRPFADSNEAKLPRRWRPKGDDRRLHDELFELRDRYHAHATHTPDRRLENATVMLGRQGRPLFTESWTRLSSTNLRRVADLAGRLAETFHVEAERRDVELFGPADDSGSDA